MPITSGKKRVFFSVSLLPALLVEMVLLTRGVGVAISETFLFCLILSTELVASPDFTAIETNSSI